MKLMKVIYQNNCGERMYKYIVAESPRAAWEYWDQSKRAPVVSMEVLDRCLEVVEVGKNG